ncbi:hypothetical protein BgiMline_021861 [Biomphalaria glabrata]|nr:hypothetical protein BgiMline_028427 [Biomphalaria glabrata]
MRQSFTFSIHIVSWAKVSHFPSTLSPRSKFHIFHPHCLMGQSFTFSIHIVSWVKVSHFPSTLSHGPKFHIFHPHCLMGQSFMFKVFLYIVLFCTFCFSSENKQNVHAFLCFKLASHCFIQGYC